MTIKTYDIALQVSLIRAQPEITRPDPDNYQFVISPFVPLGEVVMIDTRSHEGHWARTNGHPDWLVSIHPEEIKDLKTYSDGDETLVLIAIVMLHRGVQDASSAV